LRGRAQPLVAARALKEKHAFVNPYDSTSWVSGSYSATLPDGQIVEIQASHELFRCTEALCTDLSASLAATLTSCDMTLCSNVSSNVVLAGGSSALRGLAARLSQQVARMQPHLNVQCEVAGALAAWRGASTLASHSSFQRMLVTQQEFEEYGPRVLYRNPFETYK
jgi:hypothetical protein